LTDSPDEKIFLGFNALKFGRAGRSLCRRLGLCLSDLLLNVFEVLKRLEFHPSILPQEKSKKK
jgi:hypothetical protein